MTKVKYNIPDVLAITGSNSTSKIEFTQNLPKTVHISKIFTQTYASSEFSMTIKSNHTHTTQF